MWIKPRLQVYANLEKRKLRPPLSSRNTSSVQIFCKSSAVAFIMLCTASFNVSAIEKITLWPTILFLRGQDLCQYQDAYGQTRNESAIQATNQLKELIYAGVDSNAAVGILMAVDGLIDKNRATATAGQGMDIT